ncbi:T9SS type A sorting domain-containing protein [bacterium]|nr:T9SS type A sorting domain-containing protein [bacterium]
MISRTVLAPHPPLPPEGGNRLTAFIEHGDWNLPTGDAFARDFRSPADLSDWTFEVSTDEAGLVTLNFGDVEAELPEEFGAVLLAPGGEQFDLVSNPVVEWTFDANETVVFGLTVGLMSAEETAAGLPTEYAIESLYPNPFNPELHVRVALPEASRLRVEVYDLLGRRVATLADQSVNAGRHSFHWFAGEHAAGVYFVRATASNGWIHSAKAILLK